MYAFSLTLSEPGKKVCTPMKSCLYSQQRVLSEALCGGLTMSPRLHLSVVIFFLVLLVH